MPVDVPDWSSVAQVSSPAQVLGQLAAGAGATVTGTALTLPAGSQAVGVVAYLTSPNVIPASFSITGNVTGVVYPLRLWRPTGPQWTELAPSDTAVTPVLTAPAGNPSIIDILASPLLPAVQVPGWMPQTVVAISATLVPGATQTVIAAVTGAFIYLFGLRYVHQAAAATGGQFQDANGVAIDLFDQNNALNPGPISWGGVPMNASPGSGLQIKNTGGANMKSIIGTLSYFQG